MNIYEKLQEARRLIRDTKTKKAGTNEYSKYDYFTPEQVENLVSEATEATKTICLTSLVKDEFGYAQKLSFLDLENPKDSIQFELRTEKPSITATNDTQQMGGMDTYSERYIKMKVFQIKDNNLDFDAQDNRPAQAQQATKPVAKPAAKAAPVAAPKAAPAVKTDYEAVLKGTKTLADLQKAWASIPGTQKPKLQDLKDDLKMKYQINESK